jgi:hypothetical protein
VWICLWSTLCWIFVFGHKVSVNELKRIEIIQSTFFDRNGMELEINDRQKLGGLQMHGKLNDTLLNNQWVNEEITREIRKYFGSMAILP